MFRLKVLTTMYVIKTISLLMECVSQSGHAFIADWNAPLPFPFPLRLEDVVAIAFSKPFFANNFGDNPNRKHNDVDDDDKGLVTFVVVVVVVGENVALRSEEL